MFAKFATKTKPNGTVIIDKDRSFLALIESLEPLYEELLNDDNFNKEMRNILLDENEFISLIKNDVEEDAIYLVYTGIIFYIVDPDYRNINYAISIIKNSEKFEDSFLKFFCNYILGFLYYCAPSGIKQSKNIALSFFKKLEEIDQDLYKKYGVMELIEIIEKITIYEKDDDFHLLSTHNIDNLSITSNTSLENEDKSKNLWTTVLNIAVNSLSKISADKLNDPIFMKKALGKAYELLPFWVRAVVSEELFFNFCFDRRSLILDRLADGQPNFQISEEEFSLPEDGEHPLISKDTILVNIVERHCGKLFSEEKFYFFPTMESDKFNNAYKAYIKEALEKYGIAQNKDGFVSRSLKAVGVFKNELSEELGIPLFMYDATSFGSCKTGFLITTKMFIVKETMNKPMLIKLKQITSFELKKSFLSAGKIYINNQPMIDCFQGKKESFHNFLIMFNEIINAA